MCEEASVILKNVLISLLSDPARFGDSIIIIACIIINNNNNLFKSHASVMPSLYRLMSDYTMIYIIIHKRKDNRRLMILKKIVN